MTDRREEDIPRIRAALEDAGEAAVDRAEDGLDAAHRYLKRQLQERPLAVAGAALGLGVLLGLLLRRR